MNALEQKKEVDKRLLSVNHHNWLNDNTTKHTLRVLEDRINRVTDFIAKKSKDKDVSDAMIRWYTVELETLKSVKKEIYDTTTFVTRPE